MEFEYRRVETYAKWNKSFIDIRRLASSGLYYTGTNDTVTCVFCKVLIHQFDGNDCVIDVHTKFSPRCMQRYHPTNIPLIRIPQEIAGIRLEFNRIYTFYVYIKTH